MSSVAIIIPTFNEEQTIEHCIQSVLALKVIPNELIIADGGSTDSTQSIAEKFTCKFITCPKKGRAQQQDFAARTIESDIIIFLHADTLPHPDLIPLVEKTLVQRHTVLGAFRSIMKGKKTRWFISFHNFIKSYYAPFFFNPYKAAFKGLRLLFGDQILFCRKDDYLKSGGFDLKEVVMEEAAFCLRMNQLGSIVQLKEKVYSSDRRVVAWGVFKAHMLYILICAGWGFGISSKKLAKFYPDVR